MTDKRGVGLGIIKDILEINWTKQILIAIVGGIVGGLIFASVSPFIVPEIQDEQVALGAEKPTLGVEVKYAGDSPGRSFSIDGNETYDRYQVLVHNPSDKVLRYVTVGLAFPGGIKAHEMGHFQVSDEHSYSHNAELVAAQEVNDTVLVTNAISIPQLPPGKEVSATFLIDPTWEETPIPGYWDLTGLDDYNVSRGSIMVSGHYQWEFKGSFYTEERSYKYVNASARNSPTKYDFCVGRPWPDLCTE